MTFVKRNERGDIVAVSEAAAPGFEEQVAGDDPQLARFLDRIAGGDSDLAATDRDFVRVLEDVVQLLIDKGVILFTDLPESAQQKILHRQRLRSELSESLDLLEDD